MPLLPMQFLYMGINAFVAYEVFVHGYQCVRRLWCAILHMGMNAFVAYEVFVHGYQCVCGVQIHLLNCFVIALYSDEE